MGSQPRVKSGDGSSETEPDKSGISGGWKRKVEEERDPGLGLDIDCLPGQ